MQYGSGVALLKMGKSKEALFFLEKAAMNDPEAKCFTKLAQAYTAEEQYEKASQAYYKAAQAYLNKGSPNDYLIQKAKGDSLSTKIQLFIEENSPFSQPYKLAKFEPASGLYIGAFVEYDINIGPKNVQKFNEITNKNHAVYFTYHEYGKPFPVNWAAQVKEVGAAAHLAFEPNKGLDIVQDDEYLHSFAKAANHAGFPIFLRFASEMNGAWTAWNGNPEKYIEKFRLVANVMAKEAPNVAMVWAPSSGPQRQITKYYPGDQWVDWVGVNLYSVCYFNGDISRPAAALNPLDSLDFVYKTYSSKKPIQVSEFASTHFSKAGNLSTPQFCINKMNMLYQGVRLSYPRVKNINWFSANNLKYTTKVERRLNNFSLTENPEVLDAYKKLISNPYFLSEVVNGPTAKDALTAKTKVLPLQDRVLSKSEIGLAWIKLYDPFISKVVYKLDNKILSTSYQYPFSFPLDIDKLNNGSHNIQVLVYDSKNKEATRQTFSFSSNK